LIKKAVEFIVEGFISGTKNINDYMVIKNKNSSQYELVKREHIFSNNEPLNNEIKIPFIEDEDSVIDLI